MDHIVNVILQLLVLTVGNKLCSGVSLCALIYHNVKAVSTCNDLVQIKDWVFNNFFSKLSQCTGQVYLMQTELPAMMVMSEKNYQLHYSDSYTDNLHNSDSIIEGYQYSLPIDSAFASLLPQNYSSFILTIGCIGVSIYHTQSDNGSYKIFDSRARGEYGRSQPQGTCVLLEVPSIQGLVQYFQAIHSLGDNYELRGLHISTYEITAVNSVREQCNCTCKQCCAVGLYAMCYSTAKSCSYWKSKTLCCITDQGNKFYHHLSINRHLTSVDLPKSLDVCGVGISVQLKAQSYGILHCTLNNAKSKLENLIFHNYNGRVFTMAN